MSAVEALKDTSSSRLSNEMKYIVGKMDKDEAAAVGAKLIAYLDTHKDNVASTLTRELGETFAEPEKVFPDGSSLPIVKADSNLANAVAGV